MSPLRHLLVLASVSAVLAFCGPKDRNKPQPKPKPTHRERNERKAKNAAERQAAEELERAAEKKRERLILMLRQLRKTEKAETNLNNVQQPQAQLSEAAEDHHHDRHDQLEQTGAKGSSVILLADETQNAAPYEPQNVSATAEMAPRDEHASALSPDALGAASDAINRGSDGSEVHHARNNLESSLANGELERALTAVLDEPQSGSSTAEIAQPPQDAVSPTTSSQSHVSEWQPTESTSKQVLEQGTPQADAKVPSDRDLLQERIRIARIANRHCKDAAKRREDAEEARTKEAAEARRMEEAQVQRVIAQMWQAAWATHFNAVWDNQWNPDRRTAGGKSQKSQRLQAAQRTSRHLLAQVEPACPPAAPAAPLARGASTQALKLVEKAQLRLEKPLTRVAARVVSKKAVTVTTSDAVSELPIVNQDASMDAALTSGPGQASGTPAQSDFAAPTQCQRAGEDEDVIKAQRVLRAAARSGPLDRALAEVSPTQFSENASPETASALGQISSGGGLGVGGPAGDVETAAGARNDHAVDTNSGGSESKQAAVDALLNALPRSSTDAEGGVATAVTSSALLERKLRNKLKSLSDLRAEQDPEYAEKRKEYFKDNRFDDGVDLWMTVTEEHIRREALFDGPQPNATCGARLKKAALGVTALGVGGALIAAGKCLSGSSGKTAAAVPKPIGSAVSTAAAGLGAVGLVGAAATACYKGLQTRNFLAKSSGEAQAAPQETVEGTSEGAVQDSDSLPGGETAQTSRSLRNNSESPGSDTDAKDFGGKSNAAKKGWGAGPGAIVVTVCLVAAFLSAAYVLLGRSSESS